ncbi:MULTISPECIES: AbrB/MazE/SpoVT family DNA-binding domain-containing protein [Bacillus cereus group]|uniref:AbrB/MazE/SpoVT family DNA-binding domain-containing protein n=1 Tax=Bacillus cereus group TaxID=86661 RepID=UPI000D863FAE|nr:AbrB family transcriptional regulator [Bacillus cereus]SPT76342.1 transition state regulatory protein AbrB [Bacillus cereus]
MNEVKFTRNLDAYGRIVIPQDLRLMMHMQNQDKVDIYPMHNYLILKKHAPSCFITGKPTTYPLSFLKGKLLLSPEGVQLLQKELDDYQQTQMKLAAEPIKQDEMD